MSRDRLDCVVIGYNDIDFDDVLADAKATEQQSPIYSELKRSTARFRGVRRPYMSLLNAAMEEATGAPSSMHVCELPSLGVAYLTSFLRRRGLSADYINFYSNQLDDLKRLLAQSPRSVAITPTFYVDNAPIIDIVKLVREHSPSTRIIVGGPHIYNICEAVDARAQDYLFGTIGADIFVFDSQGESALAAVVKKLHDSDQPDLSDVPNLIYSAEGQPFRRTERQVEDNDMDSNVIDWSLFPPKLFTPTVQLRTARSCAFNCAFCRYPAVGGALKLNSVDVVERDLLLLKDAGVRNVVFIDDTFNVPLPRFKNLCRSMIKNDVGLDWYSYFRCSNSDAEAFDLMAEAGCKGVFLGIESGDQTILNNMNKHADLDKYRVGIRSLAERGIATFCSFIVGYPGETEETVQNTISFIEETGPMFYSTGVFYYDNKAPVAERADEFKLKGGGFNWRHATMDWKGAVEQADLMYRSVKNSTVLPTFMFDFWSIPYLAGMGFSVEQIAGFAKIAQEMLVRGLDDDDASTHELESRLVDYLRNGGAPRNGARPALSPSKRRQRSAARRASNRSAS